MAETTQRVEILRFDRVDRISHALLIVSFLGLSLSGLPLLFSHAAWASVVAHALGGFHAAGLIHRFCAILLIGVFVLHVGRVMYRLFIRKNYEILWGPESMTPQPRDAVQMWQHFKFFLGLGPRPHFDHFAYWEKFDYWAVFWGMFIIGGSGLLLWFPEFFSLFLPGWVFNVGLLIHGEEALLATSFIFIIHFFNENLRPSRFPMTNVMFSGRLSLEELAEEKPAEYERYVAAKGEGWTHAPPAEPWVVPWGRAFGGAALLAGLSLLVLMVWAVLS
jgi:cytochrome b subunit of formate dehydrogenase